jgi:hypothetical protein
MIKCFAGAKAASFRLDIDVVIEQILDNVLVAMMDSKM